MRPINFRVSPLCAKYKNHVRPQLPFLGLVYYPSWRPFPFLVGTAYYSGTNGRTPFRPLALPRVTRIAPCGVFVTFRDAKRFVFRARTNPKDAAPCRRRGEGRANSVSNEAKPNGRMLPSTAVSGTALQRRSRPFGREFSCFSPKGSAVRTDKQLPQRGKPHFSAAMANQG